MGLSESPASLEKQPRGKCIGTLERMASGIRKGFEKFFYGEDSSIYFEEGKTLAPNEQQRLATDLISRRRGYVVIDHLEKFPSIDRNELVRRLLDADMGGLVLMSRSKLGELDEDVNRRIEKVYYLLGRFLLPPH